MDNCINHINEIKILINEKYPKAIKTFIIFYNFEIALLIVLYNHQYHQLNFSMLL